ncbi:cell wall hydrolase [Pelotomaculum propionicicum]|uniref:Spore cortex-lytic enzyme n=1 Tax=Pelotomaculum propionicicum TaxID=258475 RepID=A0A4Y7RTZ6_9FIRM|nr:cell wall hydrolase [Pelotomaculum propionicicum]NLI12828.1 LysM peptidoglycan-binding domain-containing protein [Peptococcaceae bacterium]TEB12250.1 Spore cortex-lytic enzyme [Pelotomaculum propionicicum]
MIVLVVILTIALSPLALYTREQEHRCANAAGSRSLTYTVKEGDTLYDIAGNHRIELSELMKANNLTGSLILPGDTLVLPSEKTTPVSLSRGIIPGGISEEELILLARLIHAEARGESFLGQVAVGAVIMNRLASPHFPKTITKVIYQRSSQVYQFSPVADGSINLEPDEKAVQAALRALNGEDPTGGALFFYNPDLSRDSWIRSLPVITRIGNHVFATCV